MMQLWIFNIAWQRLVGNERGAEVMEYVAWAGALLVAIVAISLSGATTALADKITAIVNAIQVPGGGT